MILLGVVIVLFFLFFFLQVKGMDLARLTREAQGTEVALGVSTLVMLKTLGTTCM